MTDQSNPFSFDQTEAWDVSTSTILSPGNHIVQLDSLEPGTSSGNYPQVVIKSSNANGSITDWFVITPASFGKVPQLCNAVGVAPSDEEKAHMQQNAGAMPGSLLARMAGKRVGIVVREEDDRMDPTRKRTRVQGYVPAADLAPGGSSDVTPPGSAGGFTSQASANADIEIPFLWDGSQDLDGVKTHACRPL